MAPFRILVYIKNKGQNIIAIIYVENKTMLRNHFQGNYFLKVFLYKVMKMY